MQQPKADVLRVAVGSQNPVKIQAVRDAISEVWPAANCLGCSVESGVPAQPRSEEEAIRGATNRAMSACKKLDANLGVGLEGYTVDTSHGMFLSAWVAIVRQEDLERKPIPFGLGSSGRLLVPNDLAEKIRHGDELGPLMDQATSQQNTKQKHGAVGVLTNGLINRQEGLRTGVLCALARFVSPINYT